MGKFPSSDEISALFQDRFSASGHDIFDANVDQNVDVIVTGQDHPRAGHNLGKADFRREFERTMATLDSKKSSRKEIVRVIGGGDSPWAAVEVRVTGTTMTGKPYDHEIIYTVKFNKDHKITVIRVYADTTHVASHIGENKLGRDHVGDNIAKIAKIAT